MFGPGTRLESVEVRGRFEVASHHDSRHEIAMSPRCVVRVMAVALEPNRQAGRMRGGLGAETGLLDDSLIPTRRCVG
ncbi:hypothetical protein SAMN05444166_1828 [Singulisphaera sp. GP187]|nr:hypothetical protein SAMN05444166_1828 [Singulisphaera sp. GP187]